MESNATNLVFMDRVELKARAQEEFWNGDYEVNGPMEYLFMNTAGERVVVREEVKNERYSIVVEEGSINPVTFDESKVKLITNPITNNGMAGLTNMERAAEALISGRLIAVRGGMVRT